MAVAIRGSWAMRHDCTQRSPCLSSGCCVGQPLLKNPLGGRCAHGLAAAAEQSLDRDAATRDAGGNRHGMKRNVLHLLMNRETQGCRDYRDNPRGTSSLCAHHRCPGLSVAGEHTHTVAPTRAYGRSQLLLECALHARWTDDV